MPPLCLRAAQTNTLPELDTQAGEKMAMICPSCALECARTLHVLDHTYIPPYYRRSSARMLQVLTGTTHASAPC